ncbi:hypothetical protein [Candidatus Palauibacter polyketidifaciens]|uniref:hypothetical protein n=1 Tax=Candidatus Palauibacter polyketidifaciens TaxID=3056740 RepID=UPI002395BF46|nr:hypothetical protein [Candidatus Palauibacter polyketidifaciens]MDE2719286.1 hypothetical protein [Candidatus Palauibacter polyketidifaciens]
MTGFSQAIEQACTIRSIEVRFAAILGPVDQRLNLDEIKDRKTTVRRPQSNGFIERFHRTLLEPLGMAGSATWYESVEETQGGS